MNTIAPNRTPGVAPRDTSVERDSKSKPIRRSRSMRRRIGPLTNRSQLLTASPGASDLENQRCARAVSVRIRKLTDRFFASPDRDILRDRSDAHDLVSSWRKREGSPIGRPQDPNSLAFKDHLSSDLRGLNEQFARPRALAIRHDRDEGQDQDRGPDKSDAPGDRSGRGVRHSLASSVPFRTGLRENEPNPPTRPRRWRSGPSPCSANRPRRQPAS